MQLVCVWLHLWNNLDRRGARSNDDYLLTFPLVLLILLRPAGRMHESSLEFIKPVDLGPLGLVKQARAVPKDVTCVGEAGLGTIFVGSQ